MKVDAIGTVPTFEDIGINPNPVDAGAVWKETENLEVPNAVDTSTGALEERTNRSVEQIRKEFAESRKQQNEWRDRIVKMSMAQAADTVPDDEVRINALARQFNAPTEMVRNYRQLFEAQARDQKLSEFPVAHPKTTNFLSDPNNARIAHDDIDNLSKSEDIIDSIVAYPRAFSAGIVRDFLGNRMKGVTERILASNYTTRMMQDVYTGSIGMTDDRLVGDWNDIDMSEYKTMRNVIMSPAQAVIDTGNRIDVPDNQKTFGVQVASGLGQVAAQIASGIVEGPTGQLQALFDQGIGAVSDDILKDVEKAKKEGRTIDFSSRLAATLGGGVATAITEKASLELLGSPIANRIANRAARFAARTLVGGLSEGAQEVAESGLQTFIRRQLTNPDAKYQTGAEMFEEFTVAGTVGAIVANMLGLRRFRIGQATEKGIKALNDTAKASQLRGRDKQAYKTLVSTQTEGTPLENAYINTEAWQTYFQKQGLDPKEQAERYGVTNYDEAVTTGTDLMIPFPEYQSDFSASDHAPYFLHDTKLSEKGMTVNERETYLQRLDEQARETEELLEQIGKESENARAINDILSELTDEVAIQLESRYDKKTARTQATLHARAFMNPLYRDIVERAREEGKDLSPDDIAGKIRDQFARYGLTVNANATLTSVNNRKNIDPAIDAQLEKLRRNELPKERDVYGQSLMEYIRKKGGLRPDDITRDLVKNKQLPRSILNEKSMGADELASLQDVLDFGLDTETMQGDNALLDALVAEYTTGEKRYSNTQLNSELLSEAQALNDLSRDLAAAGIDLSNTDNAAVREALSKYYEEQNGENTREEPEASETLRYEQRAEKDNQTKEQRERITEWLSEDNIEKAIGKTREQIFSEYDNTPQPIANVPFEYLKFFNGKTSDNRVYSGHAYLINHAVNHHRDIPLEMYQNIQDILNTPDEIIRDTRNKKDVLIFTKRFNRNVVLAVSLEENNKGKLVMHKSLAYNRNKKPYPKLDRVNVSVGADPQYSRTSREVPGGRRLSALDNSNISETSDAVNSDEVVDSNKEDTLYQKKNVVRGATIIHPDRTMRIELFKDANYSTFVHETAHFMLEVYGDLASDPQSSEYIRNEYATIRKYLGAKDGEAITHEQHEKFARSFEAYLMEGKAPSPELQGIFSRFKNWLLNIYRSMRGLNVRLNKDIREVFDRMLASDEEIAVMRDASELQPLFATAEKMGIAQDEFDAYRNIAEKELIDAQDRFRQKAMKAKLREKRKGYKEELEAEKKRVEKEYDRDPVVAAFNDLTSDNDFSLNEAELRRIYGKSFLAKLPRQNGKRIYSQDGQVSLEELAEGLGFNSGDELIRAIAQLPERQTYIEDKARQNIIDREGDVLNSDNIADEAENALHNEYMKQRLKKELAVLNRLKRAGKAAKLSEQRKRIEQRKEAKRIEEDVNAKVEAMEVAARSVIAEKPIKELKPNLYLRAMQKASRKARQAFNRTDPDYTAAARQKQAEIMNNILYREATRVQKELNRRTLQAKAVVRKPLKDAVKTRDSLFVNRAKYIAAKLGLSGNADVIMQRIKTEEQNRQDVGPFRYDLAVPLRELNTATALDVLEDVKANWDQARRGKVMLIDGKRVEIDEAAKALSDKLADFGKTWRSSSRDDSLRNTLLKIIGSQTLDHTRVEAWCDMVDGARLGEETGPWMKYVFNPVKQAADKTRLSQDEYTQRLTDIIDGFQFTRETIEAPELGYTFGKDTGYGKAELIHAILHTGNMSNFQRLLVGRGWGSVLNGQVNAANWNAFMSRVIAEGRITEQDFDRVQQIWDLFDELKPQSQKAYKEVFGRYFDEITATPFTMFGKRYAGGYVPVIYDPRESGTGEKQLNPTMDLLNEMGTAFPRLQAGWGNSRKEGNFGPLLLDLSRLRDHISRQILFANMAPVNKDVSRLLNRKNVSDTIRGYDPEFMGTVIKPWMSRSVTQNLEASGQKETRAGRYARVLRQRAGAITMFFSVTNTIEQVFDMTAAYSKVKGRYLTDAFRTMVSDRAGTVQAVMEASVYMRGRMSAEIMAANGRMEQALRPGKLKKANQWMIDHAYFMQTSVDKFCGTLTWVAAYNQATEAGLSHRDAVLQADSVVRQVFGANAAEDVSNFEAGGPFRRLFTQFTGYFVQRANLIAGEYSKIQRSDIANKKAAAAMLLLQTVLLPAWIGAALRKFATGSDDDETFASWLLDVFGWGTFNYGLSMGGHVGQIANAAIDSYRGKSFSSGRVFYPPVFKMIEDAFKFRKWEDSDGDFDASKFIQDMAEIERIIPGLPIIPARPVATARYIYDVATDEVEPTGGYDFVRGVVTGRASPDSRR